VNASNNTIEDVHLETFYDGIQIGNVASPSVVGNVVVSNVDAANNGSGPVQNVVHICGGQHSGRTLQQHNRSGHRHYRSPSEISRHPT
jgi:hypothetical protein